MKKVKYTREERKKQTELARVFKCVTKQAQLVVLSGTGKKQLQQALNILENLEEVLPLRDEETRSRRGPSQQGS
jgi:hypothetical protein